MALRFGLLGTGYWAGCAHAPALAAHSGVTFIGVWGRDPEKAGTLAERYGVRPYADVDALIADVDAVAVALPPDVQAELAVRAARAGRHLLLDKPLAFHTGDADRIVAEVDRAGLVSRVFFTNRFFANVASFLAESAEAGGWDGARATMFASIFQPGNPYGASAWRREFGGLWDIGPHALSMIVPVLGPVTAVSAMTGPHATTHLLLRHDSGAVSSVALTLDAPPAALAHEFLFYGASGFVTVPGGDGEPVDAFGTAITQMISDVAAGRTRHECDVRFGRDVVAVLAAAAEACRTGRAVTLPERSR